MENKILVETSARHIHLTQEAFDILMGMKEGEHASLVERAPLSQPGQFVSTTRLNLVGPDNPKTGKPRIIAGVSILGPLRKENQVEVSATDARTLGVKAPIRQSGDVAGSAPIKLVNPENGAEFELKEGVIIAKRHIHMTPEDAENFGVEDNEIVYVRVKTPERETIFGDVVVRVSPKFSLAMHIDTDESNAANCSGEVYGELVDCDCDCDCCEGEECGCEKE
ncbi:MAG: phosphate propanoyltransferase [Erysipelotrichaceae bacterium]|jgi:putative phosphotransacetylase|nr:phosphate propanoyltransferase [Erysipelotrichaceae bacterium]